MMSYMELCEDCDRVPTYPSSCYHFLIEGQPGIFGYMTKATVHALQWDVSSWEINHTLQTVQLLGTDQLTQQAALNKTLLAAKENHTFQILSNWTGERMPIYGATQQVILDVERAAAPLFGIPTYGVHLNVFVETGDGISIWAARRAPHKVHYPNKLSVLVGGGLPTGETPFECLVREAFEEASLAPELTTQLARPAGAVSYVTVTDRTTSSGGEEGLIRPEVQYVYDMKVGAEVLPRPNDMASTDIRLYSIAEIKAALDGGEFTPANACILLDFFIRHGFVTFENEINYTRIISRLHRPL